MPDNPPDHPGMPERDVDAVDREFQSMIAASFPDAPSGQGPRDHSTDPDGLPVWLADEDDEEAGSIADLEDEEDVPPAQAGEPLPPIRRWTVPAIVGTLGLTWSIVAVLLVVFGIRLPVWVGWLTVACFVGGFVLLISQLPRSRPPDDDGAVV